MSFLSPQELALYKDPPHRQDIDNPTHFSHKENILCGDNMTIKLIIKNNKIIQAGFMAEGCILNIVSGSKLISKILHHNIDDLNLDSNDWLKSFEFTVPVGRSECVLLSLATLQEALVK